MKKKLILTQMSFDCFQLVTLILFAGVYKKDTLTFTIITKD